jgi:hypothetical protein
MAKLPPQPIGVAPGHSFWNDWYEKLRNFVDSVTHNGLTGLQGGGASEYYHLTLTQHTDLTAGFTGTGTILRSSILGITTVVPLAKITVAGTDGSLTFTNGLLTAQVDPT